MTSQYNSISDSYRPAADRHLSGSTTLLLAGEYEEAAYVAGYVTECTLKHVVKELVKDNPRRYCHNVTSLSNAILLFAQGNAQFFTSQYILNSPTLQSADIINNWIPELRYKPLQTITSATAQQWVQEATDHHKILQEMWKDGYP